MVTENIYLLLEPWSVQKVFLNSRERKRRVPLRMEGSELMLLDLTQEALASAHWATGVNTGRYALELGPPPRYTAPEGADPYL